MRQERSFQVRQTTDIQIRLSAAGRPRSGRVAKIVLNPMLRLLRHILSAPEGNATRSLVDSLRQPGMP